MASYVVRRVLYSIPVLIISTFLSFTFISLAGDPRANLRANPNFSVQTYNHLEHKYHLDRSIPVRYGYWVQDVVHAQARHVARRRRSRSGPTSSARSATRAR